MTVSSAIATTGLSATVTPTGTLTANDIRVGEAAASVLYSDADVVYSMLAFFGRDSPQIQWTPKTGSTAGSDTFVAGTAQVETATAAGTISAGGNATVTVTAAGMTGSPKAISVAVATSDTAATWAGKVRTALAADADVSAMFDVSGTTTAIVLTRKSVVTTTLGSVSLPSYPVNDATLNIALADGTCTGITPAASSANTTAGVETTGVKIYDGDGKDVEGVTLPTIVTLYGIFIRAAGSDIDWTGNVSMAFTTGAGNTNEFISGTAGTALGGIDSVLTGTGATGSLGCYAYMTVIGRTT